MLSRKDVRILPADLHYPEMIGLFDIKRGTVKSVGVYPTRKLLRSQSYFLDFLFFFFFVSYLRDTLFLVGTPLTFLALCLQSDQKL